MLNFPELCAEWSSKNNKKPEFFSYGSNFYAIWKCKKCRHKWKSTINNRTRGRGCPICTKGSQISISCIKWLNDLGIKQSDREKYIIINNKKFIVDAYVKGSNTIYEYLGNFWHGNPEKFDPNNIHPIIGIKFGDLYNKTISRLSVFKENGFNVIYVWGD